MTKKTMLIVLAVVTAAFLALPALGAAQEVHLEPGAGEKFTATGSQANIFSNEPTITANKLAGNGELTTNTTGSFDEEYLESHTTVLGMELSCHTPGAATGVIDTKNVFHLIKITAVGKPGILITPQFPTIVCGAGLAEKKFVLEGNGVIGTIVAPGCGTESTEVTLRFAVSGTKQEHMGYTGVNYDLELTTHGVVGAFTAALQGESLLKFGKKLKLNCT